MTHTRGDQRLWSDAAELFTRWRAGETAAIDELVRLLTPVLWQIARAQRLDEPTASDVVQNAWLSLVRRPESVRDPRAVGGWLVTATRREAWRATRQGDSVDTMPEDQLPAPAAISAEAVATTQFRDRALWQAVAKLDDRCQRLLRVAAFLDRPNYSVLAADLGMPVGSIGPTRGRCLTKLRTMLESQGEDHA